jgi:general secretion pathway protein A
MYCEFYQLTERPFNVTPDPKFLYLNARYREAIASLNYGITQRKGFITLIGEAGTGKTTLLKRLLDDLDATTKSVFIFNTNVSFEEILEYIFAEFDLPVHNGKKLYMLQRLNTFLLNELQGGGNVALLIDEAQDLEFSVLEDLRLLSNLETAKEKILQIVLSGQPELGQKLSNPILRQLRQRIGINCRLLPLSRDEISEYIRFRLQAAGCSDLKLFSRDAEDQIYHFSRGIPRLVNVVCDNALVIGYALGRKRIGADVINEAAADLLSIERSIEEPASEVQSPSLAPPPTAGTTARWRARLGVIGVVVTAILLGLLSVGRTMLNRRLEEPVAAVPPPFAFEVIRPGSQPIGSGLSNAPPPGAGSEKIWEESEGVAAAPETGRDPDALAVGEGGTELLAEKPIAVAALPDNDAASHEPDSRRAPVAGQNGPTATTAGHPEAAMGAASAVVGRGSVANSVSLEAARPPDHVASRPAGSESRSADAFDVLPAAIPVGDALIADVPPVPVQRQPKLDGVRFAEKVVRPGDSISQIAMQRYGQATYTILDMLKLANPDLRDVDVISVGQTIRLPELGDGFPTLVDGSGRYALLVFSTPRSEQATNLQNALKKHGFDARVSMGKFGSQRDIYRVVLSGFGDRSQVAATGRQLQRVLREDTRIAKLGEQKAE